MRIAIGVLRVDGYDNTNVQVESYWRGQRPGNMPKNPRPDESRHDREDAQVEYDDVGQSKTEAKCQISHFPANAVENMESLISDSP